MFFFAWFHPPRHLLPLFLLVTLVPSALLVYSGWRLLEQDRALQLQQAQERREQTADLAVVNLRQKLDVVTRRLEDPAPLPRAEDAASIIFTADSVEGRLLFYPFTVVGKEALPNLFARGDELEFRVGDFTQAAAWFDKLARSSDPVIRAGALIRQARNFRRAGETGAALMALGAAGQIPNAGIAGVPADLFARWAECDLLNASARTAELRERAFALREDLLGGRWRLGSAAFNLHWNDTALWVEESSSRVLPPPADEFALASAAEWIWNKWKGGTASKDARESVVLEGRRMTLAWKADPGRLVVWIAGPDYVQREWLATLSNVRLTDFSPAAAGESRRFSTETGLPWNIVVESTADDLDPSRLVNRRNLWLAGLGMLVLLVISGAYLIARTAARELAVARLQSDFVSAVSHEFRTPLTSVRQITEVLRDGRVPSEDCRRSFYDNLARQSERLHQLVESLLDFGRMEAGTSPYRLEHLDACAWARSVVEQFNHENSARGYQVELEVNGAAAIAADPQALTNALWNLLENAVKYSPDCHTVWVNVERDREHLVVRVRDHGLGIPLEEQKEIFRKFVRGRDAKVRSIKGTGIGLAMVDHIIKAHGGEVRVESQPGLGSTFIFLLPCQEY